MQVELSQHEIELLNKALDAYEVQASSEAFQTSLLSIMLCSKEEREKEKFKTSQDFKNADEETKKRKQQTILLKAKLIQASAKQSEHEVSPN